MSAKVYPAQAKIIKFCEESPEGKRMLDQVASSVATKFSYSKGVKNLCTFLNKTSTQIVTEYIQDIQGNNYAAFDKWERIFEDFTIYLKSLKNEKTLRTYSSSTVALLRQGAKALINTNVPRSLRLQVKSLQVNSREIPPITMENLKEVYAMCDIRERTYISILKDSGISADDALRLRLKDLEGFERAAEWIHVRVRREKTHVDYETFLGPNAVGNLRAYLTVRERRGEEIDEETLIFRSRFEVLNLFVRIHKRTGIEISTHRLRKFFGTYMALGVRHPIVLKYWMGHKIRRSRDVEARYIIPPTPEQLTLYKQSYHNIDLRGDFKPSRGTIFEGGEIVEGIPNLRKVTSDVQKVVGEKELPKHLSEGWRFVAVLRSGKIVIESNQC